MTTWVVSIHMLCAGLDEEKVFALDVEGFLQDIQIAIAADGQLSVIGHVDTDAPMAAATRALDVVTAMLSTSGVTAVVDEVHIVSKARLDDPTAI